MTYVKCAGCDVVIEIPDELSGDWSGDITDPLNPYYCDACEWQAETAVAASLGDDYNDGGEYCSHCGKDIYDFSDLGCEYCDRRHPNYGVYP
jgi:hypothetical protein